MSRRGKQADNKAEVGRGATEIDRVANGNCLEDRMRVWVTRTGRMNV